MPGFPPLPMFGPPPPPLLVIAYTLLNYLLELTLILMTACNLCSLTSILLCSVISSQLLLFSHEIIVYSLLQPMRRPDSYNDRHVMARHMAIYPNEQEVFPCHEMSLCLELCEFNASQ